MAAFVRLTGDVESSGKALAAPAELVALFNDFLLWDPKPPRDARQLARQGAPLCRFLRDEVTEQLCTRCSCCPLHFYHAACPGGTPCIRTGF